MHMELDSELNVLTFPTVYFGATAMLVWEGRSDFVDDDAEAPLDGWRCRLPSRCRRQH
jgi:hypothetical protein